MDFRCEKRYLLLPVRQEAEERWLGFFEGDTLLYDLRVHLDPEHPAWIYPLDLSRFHGKQLRVETDPSITFSAELADERPQGPAAYDGMYRPVAHFTPIRGWNNDPNGLIYSNGVWHMFFQHNPAGSRWANMHWGHAESPDLVHWRETDTALFPDTYGAPFSGSAITDHENRTGLKAGEQNPMLFFYTAAGGVNRLSAGKKFTQCLVFSTDGGRTFQSYDGNPLIPWCTGENRDPKVIWVPELEKYALALYLQEDEYALYCSEDLLHWTFHQSIRLPGDDECPDLYPLPADGNPDQIRWVFCGASDRYWIGQFEGDRFVPLSSEPGRLHWGDSSYASQSWTDAPDGRRVRTSFLHTKAEGMPFSSCMSIPAEMSLKTIGGTLRLCAQPVPELQLLWRNTKIIPQMEAKEGVCIPIQMSSRSLDISMSIHADPETVFVFRICGLYIRYENGILRCQDQEIPLAVEDGALDLRILTDVLTVELYANRGSIFFSTAVSTDFEAEPSLELNAIRGTLTATDVRISELAPFWEF